jgi:hypothetical protein
MKQASASECAGESASRIGELSGGPRSVFFSAEANANNQHNHHNYCQHYYHQYPF